MTPRNLAIFAAITHAVGFLAVMAAHDAIDAHAPWPVGMFILAAAMVAWAIVAALMDSRCACGHWRREHRAGCCDGYLVVTDGPCLCVGFR